MPHLCLGCGLSVICCGMLLPARSGAFESVSVVYSGATSRVPKRPQLPDQIRPQASGRQASGRQKSGCGAGAMFAGAAGGAHALSATLEAGASRRAARRQRRIAGCSGLAWLA